MLYMAVTLNILYTVFDNELFYLGDMKIIGCLKNVFKGVVTQTYTPKVDL